MSFIAICGIPWHEPYGWYSVAQILLLVFCCTMQFHGIALSPGGFLKLSFLRNWVNFLFLYVQNTDLPGSHRILFDKKWVLPGFPRFLNQFR